MAHRRVYIEWVDSEEVSGWTTVDEADHDNKIPVKSCGFLVKETEKVVIIASSVDEVNGNYLGLLSIPKLAITKRRYLK
jgi:hypothetical protein